MGLSDAALLAVQAAEAVSGEPAAAAAEQTMEERIAEAEKDFFSAIHKERKRLGRESKQMKVSNNNSDNNNYHHCYFLYCIVYFFSPGELRGQNDSNKNNTT